MRRYWMEAYGCQMNIAESDAIETLLCGQMWEKADSPENADAVILNTCSVRETAESRIWGRLGFFSHLKKQRPLVLVLAGCMAERAPGELKEKAPFIDYIVGTNDKLRIVEILNQRISPDGKLNPPDGKSMPALGASSYEFAPLHCKKGDIVAYVPIMNGCNNFCTYCIVPYVRGRESSRPVAEIIGEIERLDAMGIHEIQLLGQNVNSYSCEGWTFAKLLKEICRHLDNIIWVRFDSPHPKDFGDDLIEVLASETRLARHYHIPLQSGSDRILALMNRRYDVARYMGIIEKIRKAVPEATFSTDVMVGFPSETEDEVEMTRAVMEKVGFIEAFMYYWNPREGTKATLFENQVPETEKIRRLQGIIDFQLENCARIKSGRLSGVHKVMVTQISRNDRAQMLGHNEHGEMVAFDAPSSLAIGSIVGVRFDALNGNTYQGSLVGAAL